MLQILADENIPLAKEVFGHLGIVQTLPAGGITTESVKSIDILLVRSVTKVDQSLLKDSKVRFVGTATIGIDHIDQNYLAENNVAFANAPGSNADSVVEWVLASILTIASDKKVDLKGKTLGIIGCGQIGSRLAGRLTHLGLNIMLNDPPLAELTSTLSNVPFSSLEDLLALSDIVTCHVPLIRSGNYPTPHLINKKTLSKMKKSAWLLNSGRGIVVDNLALLNTIDDDKLGATMFDVWENEPKPNPKLMGKVDLITPHIAGYSVEGKQNGTFMLLESVHKYLGLNLINLALDSDVITALKVPPVGLNETEWLNALVVQMYDIQADDQRLRAVENGDGSGFVALRKSYPRRRTFSKFSIPKDKVPASLVPAVQFGLCVEMI